MELCGPGGGTERVHDPDLTAAQRRDRDYNEGVTVQLQPEHERALEELLASGKFSSMEEAVAEAVEQFLGATQRKPIWERIQEIRQSVGDDAFDALPEDSASQLDHYIYGLPKREE